jgi:hypothetical protein
VNADVDLATKGKQSPWKNSNLTGILYLNGEASTPAPGSGYQLSSTNQSNNVNLSSDLETEYWRSVKDSVKPEELRSYINKFPNGTFVALARTRIAALEEGNAKKNEIEKANSEKSKSRQERIKNTRTQTSESDSAPSRPRRYHNSGADAAAAAAAFRMMQGIMSDMRAKTGIELVGHLNNGLGIYRFNYIGDGNIYVGVMAQEVELLVPDAVTIGIDGLRRVNYSKLGIIMKTWDEWLEHKTLDPLTFDLSP